MDPCLRTRISFQHCVSNTFGLWFRVWVQAFASCFLVKHVWMLVPCRVQTSVSTHVSNAFGLRFLVCVHASVTCPVFRMRLGCGSLSVRTHPSQPCSNTFDYGCLSVGLSQNGYGMALSVSPFSYERVPFGGGRRAHSREHRRHCWRHCWRHRWLGSCSLRFVCRDHVRGRFSLHPLMRWRTLGNELEPLLED